MNKLNYTKGDWKVSEVEGKRLTCVYTDETNIALLVHQKDAKLISKAPDMYKALEEIKYYILDMIEPSEYEEHIEEIVLNILEQIEEG